MMVGFAPIGLPHCAIAAGILETAGITFLILIAIRWYEAGALAKGLVAGGGSLGLILAPWFGSRVQASGKPLAAAASLAAAVVAPDSMTADALATTLFVLGPDEGLRFIESRTNAAALFILREPDGNFRQVPSSRFAGQTGYRP